MSDQPKPTGEWTGLSLSRLIKEKGYKGAANVHNSELEAWTTNGLNAVAGKEREIAALDHEIQQLREQLAAELEKAKELSELLDACREIRRAQQEQLDSAFKEK